MKPTHAHAARNVKINAAILAAGICAAGASHAQSYQFVDLGAGQAYGLNDAGTVVGSANDNAVLWNNGVPSYLYQSTTATNIGGYATSINNRGQIVGIVIERGLPIGTAWSPSNYATASTVMNGSGNGFALPAGINNSGVVVGGGGGAAAYVWSSTNVVGTALNFSDGYAASANGVNDAGTIVGSAASYSADTNVAVEWKNGSAIVLPGLSTGSSAAYGINNAGVVVGASGAGNFAVSTAVEWKDGALQTLGGYGGKSNQANAVNNAGLAVGYASNAAGTDIATLWRGTTAINLNSVLTPAELNAGWILTDATGINNNGWIVGDAYNSKTGATDGFVLEVSPVPEADSASMLLAGMALIGLLSWAKRGGRGRRGA